MCEYCVKIHSQTGSSRFEKKSNFFGLDEKKKWKILDEKWKIFQKHSPNSIKAMTTFYSALKESLYFVLCIINNVYPCKVPFFVLFHFMKIIK